MAARRAGEFALPIRVWALEGRDLRAIEAASPTEPRAADPAHLALVPDIEAAGATVVIEHGVITGEVLELEVCRVVDVDDERTRRVRLEVGVGPHDREAFATIHGDIPPAPRWWVSWRR